MLTTSFASLSISVRKNVLTLFILAIFMAFTAFTASVYAAPKSGYKSFIVGNSQDAPASANLSPGLVLMGGGLDVDEAFQWMCQRAGGVTSSSLEPVAQMPTILIFRDCVRKWTRWKLSSLTTSRAQTHLT